MKKVLFLALTILLIASCTKDIPETDPIQPESSITNVTIRATIDDTQTRTTVVYGNPNYKEGEIFKWLLGDVIYVHFFTGNYSSTLATFEATSLEDDGKTAIFTYYDGIIPGHGTYRVEAEYSGGNTIGTTGFQYEKNADHIGYLDFMIAENDYATISANAIELDLNFKHISSLLRFGLRNDTGETIRVEEINVRSENSANFFYLRSGPFYNFFNHSLFNPLALSESYMGFYTPTTSSSGYFSVEIEEDNVLDAYMMLLGSEVIDNSDYFIITVRFWDESGYRVQEFPISRQENPFLQQPFEEGKNYYFKLAITGENIIQYSDGIAIYEANPRNNTAKLMRSQVSGVVTIPYSIDIGGTSYTITSLPSGMGGALSDITDLTILSPINSFDYRISGSSLESISLPSSITRIGPETFHDCTSLVNIEIPPMVDKIWWRTFYNCTSLNSILLPPNIREIGESAFHGCTSLRDITIPPSTYLIESYAFSESGLEDIYITSISPPIFEWGVFYNVSGLTIHVPRVSADQYNTILNGQYNGWRHNTTETINLVSGGSVVVEGLCEARGFVTIVADLEII